MKEITAKNEKIKASFAYITAIVLCVFILIYVMKLWDAYISIPFNYYWDSILMGALIKGIIDNGWYFHNRFLGMPAGLNILDYPAGEIFNLLLMKLISLFTPDYAAVMNLYYLISFPLITLSVMFVFRQFNLSYGSSIAGGLLFSFLPYHFLRGQMHLTLSSYYTIPLVIMVMLWVSMGEFIFFKYKENNDGIKLDLFNFKAAISIIACILVSSTIYYAFFSCFFLAIAGLTASFGRKKIYPLTVSLLLVSIIFIGFFINLSPNIVYRYYNGKNLSIAHRESFESELNGMKIAQLLLPIKGHRVSFLSDLKKRYDPSTAFSETDCSTLGLIGSAGFLILIARLFVASESPGKDLKSSLTILNISGVLIGTVGGIGSVFAVIISPWIRSYNRISIYIAFFSIFIVILLIEDFFRKYGRNIKRKILFNGFLCIVLFIGVMDQTTADYAPPYDKIKKEYINDAEFINRIEASLPIDAMIFQLPYIPFPENPPVYKMTDYDLLKGYLHSKRLRWSYGAMKGREGDLWQKETASKTPEEFLKSLSLAGFSGVYLDCNGYPDMGSEMKARLSHLLGIEPMVSANNRLAFFNISEYGKKLKSKTAEDPPLKDTL